MAIITKTNFKNVLRALGFTENGDTFEKKFAAFDCSLSIDFATEKLIYPIEIKGRERNDDFEQPENFVVFECVNRLLEKGYRPEHIELEKEWHLGHDAKSGRADVCVSAPDGSMLFIVECKTAGREFDKAYKDTLWTAVSYFPIGNRKELQNGLFYMRRESMRMLSLIKRRQSIVPMTLTS